MKISALLVIPALSVSGFLLWQYRHPLHRRPGSEPRTAEIGQLRDEVARLNAQVQASNALANAAVRAASSSAERFGSANETAKSDRAESAGLDKAPPVKVSEEEMKARIRERFGDEPTDLAWSRAMEPVARSQVLLNLPPDSQIKTLDCRQATCKAELVHHDLATFQQYMTSSFVGNPRREWNGNVFASVVDTRPDGAVEVELYMFRPGEDPVAEAYTQQGTEGTEEPARSLARSSAFQ